MAVYNLQDSNIAKFFVGATGFTKQVSVNCTIYQVSSQKSKASPKYKKYHTVQALETVMFVPRV